MSIYEDLKKLVELHHLDERIRELERAVQEVPERIRALEEQEQRWEEETRQVHERWKGVRQEREEKEQQVTRLERQMQNLQMNARQARSNREYSEYMLKAEEVRHQIRRTEDELLDLMEAEDTALQAWKAAKAKLQERRNELENQRAALTERLRRLASERDRLQAEREAFVRALPKAFRREYERIAANRGGVAMAAVVDQACGACHIQLRPRVYQALRILSDLVFCESCHRILYLPDLSAEREQAASKG